MPKTFLVDGRLCVACYYPKTPTDYPSTTRGRSVGPPVAVNIDIYEYLRIWALVLSELFGYSMPLTTVQFISQCCYFNPQWTAGQVIYKGDLCLEQHHSLKEQHSCYVLTYDSGFLEGFGRWRRSILATQRNPDLHGSGSLPEQCCISDRNEQNSSKLRHTVFNVFTSRLTI